MTINRHPGLRDWQNHALVAWYKHDRIGVMDVTTGAGKSRLALEAIQEHLEDPSHHVVIIVPSLFLLAQWTGHLTGLGIKPISITDAESTNSLRGHVVVGVVNSARGRTGWAREEGSKLLVADEVHRYFSEENRQILMYDFKAFLGLSATPETSWHAREDADWIPHWLKDPIFRYTYEDAVRDGIVRPALFTFVETPVSAEQEVAIAEISDRIAGAIGAGNVEAAKILGAQRAREIASDMNRTRTAIAIACERPVRRLIVFHEAITQADAITEGVRAKGVRSMAYHSQKSTQYRAEAVTQFTTRQIDCLVTCRALDEGADLPSVDGAVIAAGTASTRQRIQRIGRAVRLSPSSERASIWIFYSTEQEFRRVRAIDVNLPDNCESRWLRARV